MIQSVNILIKYVHVMPVPSSQIKGCIKILLYEVCFSRKNHCKTVSYGSDIFYGRDIILCLCLNNHLKNSSA